VSEIMTSIHLPGLDLGDGGFAEWGIVPVTEMISAHRARAQKAKATAEAILAANDADFLRGIARAILPIIRAAIKGGTDA